MTYTEAYTDNFWTNTEIRDDRHYAKISTRTYGVPWSAVLSEYLKDTKPSRTRFDNMGKSIMATILKELLHGRCIFFIFIFTGHKQPMFETRTKVFTNVLFLPHLVHYSYIYQARSTQDNFKIHMEVLTDTQFLDRIYLPYSLEKSRSAFIRINNGNSNYKS